MRNRCKRTPRRLAWRCVTLRACVHRCMSVNLCYAIILLSFTWFNVHNHMVAEEFEQRTRPTSFMDAANRSDCTTTTTTITAKKSVCRKRFQHPSHIMGIRITLWIYSEACVYPVCSRPVCVRVCAARQDSCYARIQLTTIECFAHGIRRANWARRDCENKEPGGKGASK